MRHFGILALSLGALAASAARAADFGFFGRSGDAIEINLPTLPGVAPGATFSGLNISGLAGHTVLTSDTLTGQSFASSGRFWVFPNPARNTPALGDVNAGARGFQGTLTGSLLVNGAPKNFSVTVQPGYTGSGAGSVQQSLESQGDAGNNWLYVAQQQQRLRYLGFVSEGGAPLVIDGDFGPATNSALRTFQGAIIGGVNTTQANTDGIIGPNTAGWLNALNAPVWQEVFPTSAVTITTGSERFALSWTADVIAKGAAKAKAATGITQHVTALSTADGYGSSAIHQTHRVGTDIDLRTNSSTHNYGNGSTSTDELNVIKHAIGFIDAGATGRVIRIITSNQDIYDGIHSARPSVPLYYDASGGHRNHLHIDVGPPTRIAGRANLVGDFNLDDVVNSQDLAVWRQYAGANFTGNDFLTWQRNVGDSQSPMAAAAASHAVPEPRAISLLACGVVLWSLVAAQRGKLNLRTASRRISA
jgi:peptidoglycan hydrolase-like protein with peptidoglycan-binding domain